jgi:protein FAM50
MPNLVQELEKRREDDHANFLKKGTKSQTSPAIKCLTDKFAQSTTASSSVPIVADSKERKTETETQAMIANNTKPKTLSQKRPLALTFSLDDEEGEGGEGGDGDKMTKRVPSRLKESKKLCKDPSVRTDFLPDAERSQREEEERSRLKAEWLLLQEKKKNEEIEVVYSYWDGSGHRRSVTLKKGTSIGRFLDACRDQLKESFPELRGISSESLIYVKEDVIIPHNFSFFDLIEAKARGKSGPLFQFDVHEDIRLVSDARVEKDESHPGKVVERRWYEKNKHVFPASRWETYEVGKVFETYTIKG